VLFAAIWLTPAVVPRAFVHYEHAPGLESVPKQTVNAHHVPGDPVNVALVGTEPEVLIAFQRAGWDRADPLSWRSRIAIAQSVLRHRPDSTAPVSPLYLFGRIEDLAFEREVGRSASQRHHIRLWQVPGLSLDGRPVWVGDATYDVRAGISHRGLHPTHHIARDIDAERDTVLANLAAAGQLAGRFQVTGIGPRIGARTADGDAYDTDGEMAVGILSPGNAPQPPPEQLPDPPLVQFKNSLWRMLKR
jgi:LssY C-terminus